MTEVVERTLDVDLPVGEVWELVVDDAERTAWFGGPTTLEPVPGGRAAFTDPDGTRRVAVVRDVEHARHLSWTWWTDDDPDTSSDVAIELHPTPSGTRLTITETPRPTHLRASACAAFPATGLELGCLLRAASPVLA